MYCANWIEKRRHSRLALGMVLAVLGTPVAALAQPAPTKNLCKPDETVYFACTAKGQAAGKLVSLCVSQSGPADGTLWYRYGRPGAVELTYPKQPMPPRVAFEAGWFHYITGGNSRISFLNGGYRYSVFSAVGRWGKGRAGIVVGGVAVDKDGKRVANIVCEGAPAGEGDPAKLGLTVDPNGVDDNSIDPSPFIPE
ncbi:hypothetical protein ACLBXM_11840 [Xanthobacteraceae bacterium A53D]